MSMLITLAVVAFFVAQFTPRGQAFLATERGSLAVVALAVVAVASMAPGIVGGSVVDMVFAGVWVWIAYPRLGAASRGARKILGSRR